MSLPDWLRSGWLIEHRTSRREIADLLGVVQRDLQDCQAAGLSADWRLNIAYNAALQAATAALAASGYRAARDSHHYRVIQSLASPSLLRMKRLLSLNSSARSETSAATNEREPFPITKQKP